MDAREDPSAPRPELHDGPAAGSRPRSWLLPWVAAVAVALSLFAAQRLFITVYQVRGASMEPTLRDGQRLLVARQLGEVPRGALLVFKNPIDPGEVLVKRVLGLPGERIEVRRGKLYAAGFEIGEPFVKPGTGIVTLAPVTVPADAYYLLGDNRGDSVDSRQLGPVPRRLVLGKVLEAFGP